MLLRLFDSNSIRSGTLYPFEKDSARFNGKLKGKAEPGDVIIDFLVWRQAENGRDDSPVIGGHAT